MALTSEAISAVTADQWRSAWLHCMALVDEFWLQEENVEQLLIEENGDHDDEDEDDQDNDSSDEEVFVD